MLAAVTCRAERPASQLKIVRFVCVGLVLLGVACSTRPLKADQAALAVLPPDFIDRLRADPFNYFRFINHEWTARVCEIFDADLPRQPIVQLHGDAHVEQYALTTEAWGLDDFDDSTRGPALVDIARFLGSIELAARQRGWTRDRDRLFDSFFAGYRRGLADVSYKPAEPDIVRWMRDRYPPPTREAFLQSAETKMSPTPEASMAGLRAAMAVFARVVEEERPELPPEYFQVVRAGWLEMGIGSAVTRKILIRVRGPTDDPEDDEVLEAKTLRSLEGLGCLEVPTIRPTFRVIVGSKQVGRLRHNILAAGPEVDIAEMAAGGQHLRNWWIRSWEPSYHEITLDDLRSVDDLSAIVYDSAVQLSAGSIQRGAAPEAKLRSESLAALAVLEPRLRKSADTLVTEMMQGWRELGSR
jgi:uncharacterized protein DUF2252